MMDGQFARHGDADGYTESPWRSRQQVKVQRKVYALVFEMRPVTRAGT